MRWLFNASCPVHPHGSTHLPHCCQCSNTPVRGWTGRSDFPAARGLAGRKAAFCPQCAAIAAAPLAPAPAAAAAPPAALPSWLGRRAMRCGTSSAGSHLGGSNSGMTGYRSWGRKGGGCRGAGRRHGEMSWAIGLGVLAGLTAQTRRKYRCALLRCVRHDGKYDGFGQEPQALLGQQHTAADRRPAVRPSAIPPLPDGHVMAIAAPRHIPHRPRTW